MDDAQACEDSHARLKRAKVKQYTVGKYPFTIDVLFSDGQSRVYILEELARTI